LPASADFSREAPCSPTVCDGRCDEKIEPPHASTTGHAPRSEACRGVATTSMTAHRTPTRRLSPQVPEPRRRPVSESSRPSRPWCAGDRHVQPARRGRMAVASQYPGGSRHQGPPAICTGRISSCLERTPTPVRSFRNRRDTGRRNAGCRCSPRWWRPHSPVAARVSTRRTGCHRADDQADRRIATS